MYLISEIKKKTRTGGKGICQVFRYSNKGVVDMTDKIAERYGFAYIKGSIEIPYGSGTGIMRIRQALGDGRIALDVSVFNQ